MQETACWLGLMERFDVQGRQGGVMSPLRAAGYLQRLDVEVRTAGFRLIRYADEFVIQADRRWKSQPADRLVWSVLADIGLEVADAGSGVVAIRDGFEFRDFQFRESFLRPRPRAMTGFKPRCANAPGGSLRSLCRS